MEKIKYVCEVCGKTEIMTPEEAYQEGWDYPPFMGSYGVISARTCPHCPMMKTAWAALVLEKKGIGNWVWSNCIPTPYARSFLSILKYLCHIFSISTASELFKSRTLSCIDKLFLPG